MQIIKTPAEYAQLMTSKTPVLIDFYADWCGPCKMLAPHFAKLAESHGGKITFAKVDVDNEAMAKIVSEHQIDTIPTVIGFKQGTKQFAHVGFIGPDQLQALADKLSA